MSSKSCTAFLVFFSLLSLAEIASAQARSDSLNSEGTIVVNVWAAATPAPASSGPAAEPLLSRDFAAAGLKTTAVLKEWQRRLAYTIQNGYPLSEFWIAFDRDRAADALQLVALAASSDADRTALQQLLAQFENLRQWSDGLIEANRNLRLAPYYMSPAALTTDPMFQKTAECARFLAPMLASGRLAEDRSCQ